MVHLQWEKNITRLVSQTPWGASREISAPSGPQSVQAKDIFYCK